MQQALRAEGIVSHLEPEVSKNGDFIGFALCDGRRWQLTERKFWRLSLALRWALRPRSRASALEMRRLNGHIISAVSVKREAFSLLLAINTWLDILEKHQGKLRLVGDALGVLQDLTAGRATNPQLNLMIHLIE